MKSLTGTELESEINSQMAWGYLLVAKSSANTTRTEVSRICWLSKKITELGGGGRWPRRGAPRAWSVRSPIFRGSDLNRSRLRYRLKPANKTIKMVIKTDFLVINMLS